MLLCNDEINLNCKAMEYISCNIYLIIKIIIFLSIKLDKKINRFFIINCFLRYHTMNNILIISN